MKVESRGAFDEGVDRPRGEAEALFADPALDLTEDRIESVGLAIDDEAGDRRGSALVSFSTTLDVADRRRRDSISRFKMFQELLGFDRGGFNPFDHEAHSDGAY